MGKDFIPLEKNNISTKEAIKKLYHKDFVESASKNDYFHVLPDPKDIVEVDLGDEKAGTHETVFRLKNGDFIVVNRTMSLGKLRKVS